VAYAELSGGLGDLTDGIEATGSWDQYQNQYQDPTPWVGWYMRDVEITFKFATELSVDAIGIHLYDAGGYGGLSLPLGGHIDVGGTVRDFDINRDGGSGPHWFSFKDLGLTTSDKEIKLTLNRGTDTNWIFLSEVSFDGSPVPEPATLLLLSAGILGLAVIRKRRS